MAHRLTPKKQAWLDAYFGKAMLNATEASRIAGFKNPSQAGYRLKKELREVIETRTKDLSNQSSVSAKEVLDILSEVARDVNHRDRVRAAEILSKIHGLQSEKLTISQDRSELAQDLNKTLEMMAFKLAESFKINQTTLGAQDSN